MTRPNPIASAEWLSFRQNVAAAPDDDMARLAAADWLEERGTPEAAARADLIRNGLALRDAAAVATELARAAARPDRGDGVLDLSAAVTGCLRNCWPLVDRQRTILKRWGWRWAAAEIADPLVGVNAGAPVPYRNLYPDGIAARSVYGQSRARLPPPTSSVWACHWTWIGGFAGVLHVPARMWLDAAARGVLGLLPIQGVVLTDHPETGTGQYATGPSGPLVYDLGPYIRQNSGIGEGGNPIRPAVLYGLRWPGVRFQVMATVPGPWTGTPADIGHAVTHLGNGVVANSWGTVGEPGFMYRDPDRDPDRGTGPEPYADPIPPEVEAVWLTGRAADWYVRRGPTEREREYWDAFATDPGPGDAPAWDGPPWSIYTDPV